MQHAILISAHTNPVQVLKLTKSLEHPRLDVFIHIDKKTQGVFRDVRNELSSLSHVISTRRVNWGGFSCCEATLDLLCSARQIRRYNTYTNLSGLDFPIKSNEHIASVLDATEISGIDCWTDKDPSWHLRYARKFFYDSPFARTRNAVSRRLQKWCRRPKQPLGVKIHFGWAWWTLTHEATTAIQQFVNDRPDVVRFFRHMHIADESFFQTALANTIPAVPYSQQHRRYVDFPGGSTHPRILCETDIPSLLKSDALFARKFDERRTPGILENLNDARSAKAKI